MPPNASSNFHGIGPDTVASLWHALGGLRNRRALLALVGCSIVGVLAVGLLSALGTFGATLGGLVFLVAVGSGVNAAGLLQMDKARGVVPRSLREALVDGSMCIPKLVVLGLAFLAVVLLYFALLMLVFFVCKIPFLGPPLYAVALPVSIVLTGVLITATYACMLLSLPAIWEGSTLAHALTQTFAIARSRWAETLWLLVMIGVLCGAVGLIVFGVLFNGLVPVASLSTWVLSGGGSAGGGVSGMWPGAGARGGYVTAGFIGFGVLWSLATALVGQVYLQGLSLVYLRVTAGLDLGAAAAALQRTVDDARQRGSELAAKARAAAAPAPIHDASAADAHAAAEASAAAAYGGYSSSPAAQAGARMPSSAMASPPAYSPPPVTRPSFEVSRPPAAEALDAAGVSRFAATDVDLPGAAPTVVTGAAPSTTSMRVDLPVDFPIDVPIIESTGVPPSNSGAAPLDIEFDFDLPTAPAAASPSASADAAPTLPWRHRRESEAAPFLQAAAEPASLPSTAPSAQRPSMTITCPKCLSAASTDDAVCGVCGNRLA